MSRTARFKACVPLSGGLPRPCSLFHIDAVHTDMLSQARMEARAPSWCCVQQLHVAMQPAFFAPAGYAFVPVWGKNRPSVSTRVSDQRESFGLPVKRASAPSLIA